MSRLQLVLSSLVIVAALIVTGCAAPQQVSPTPTDNSPASAPSTTSESADSPDRVLTVYSGREEKLIGPLVTRFREETGIDVQVRYGDTAELAATILEEGQNSPADVYLAQDAGALGALTAEQRLAPLSEAILNRVDASFRAPNGEWVGISGRARTVVYNTDVLSEEDLPDSLLDFTDPKWKGKIGWAPTNGSFQSFVTALRLTEGEQVAREWLEGIQANTPKVYNNNTAIVMAVGAGEIEVGFVNHYYLHRILKEQGESFAARNYHPRGGGPGAMVNVAGAGILTTASNIADAEKFIAFLLSPESQQYFAAETFEYPLVAGVEADPSLVPLAEIKVPQIDLGKLSDLEATLRLLQEVGVI